MAVDRWVVTDSVHDRGHGVDEDRIGAVQRLAWVLDGASPLGDERVTGERSDAAWIADIVDGALRSAAQGPPASLVDVTERAIAAVVERSAEWSHVPLVPPSAAFGIVYLRDSGGLEYLVLGDVSVVIETADREVIALTDPSVARTSRPAMERFEGSLRRTRSHAVARREIDAALIEHRVSSMNRDGGYWIVANDAGATRHAMTGAIDGPVRRVLLCSDGFSRVVDTFAIASSWAEFFASYDREPRLASFVERIRACERDDPETLRHPRWSVSDDAAALMVEPAG